MQQTGTKSWKCEDFKFHEVLGRGRFGLVYSATEIKSGKKVAIKLIQKRQLETPIMQIQVKREIQVHSRLKHPNICALHGYFQDDINVYVVLELCEGNTLFKIRTFTFIKYHSIDNLLVQQSKKPMPEETVRNLLTQTVRGLDYLQKRYVMHRDLKPENIIITTKGVAKILDFGWCVHSIYNPRDTFCGTLQYLSPEMVRKKSYTDSIDIYCLGAMTYQMMYKKSPFYEQNQNEMLRNIEEGVLIFYDNISVYSQQLKDLVQRMLCNDAQKRIRCHQILKSSYITGVEKDNKSEKSYLASP